MPITQLPTPVPQRSDPVNFAVRADAFLSALPTFGNECNALALEIESYKNTAVAQASIATTQADTATTQAGIATTQATLASNYANTAQTYATNAENAYTNIGSLLGINFGSFSLVDGELIVTHISTSSVSLVDGELILTYEAL